MEGNNQLASVFEKGTTLDKKGVIIEHDLVVRGAISSRIVCATKVEIESGARVIGEIIASEMVIDGIVEGTIYVKGTVKLCANSRVNGKIYYGDIIIEKGALMSGESEKLTPEMAATVFDPSAKDAPASMKIMSKLSSVKRFLDKRK